MRIPHLLIVLLAVVLVDTEPHDLDAFGRDLRRQQPWRVVLEEAHHLRVRAGSGQKRRVSPGKPREPQDEAPGSDFKRRRS